MKQSKAELLLPAGNRECLRAAVANGADAVYLGLNRFNARQSAGNFNEQNIFSIITFCHKKNVKVYVAFNTLIKNSEIAEFLRLMSVAYAAKADAVIIQDPCFIPIIKKSFPGLAIHLSTQATVTNSYSVPDVERVILARELSYDEVKDISAKGNGRFKTEVFVHGALCFSYSGQCLFSSIAGGRSGNRGKCAQPCRMIYNNKYLLSTMDLCMLEKIPELINAGVAAFKIEGRLRSPLYVATCARIYRKYIDSYYANPSKYEVKQDDIDDLMIAFNREFTTGFAFNDSIVDSRKQTNRGLYIGKMSKGKLLLKKSLRVGDGVGFWLKDKAAGDKIVGNKVENIVKNGKSVKEAVAGDVVEINVNVKEAKELDDVPVYKTSSAAMQLNLGERIERADAISRSAMPAANAQRYASIEKFKDIDNKSIPRIFAKVYNRKSAAEADKAGADIIYYDALSDDCADAKRIVKNARFFLFTPRIMSDKQIDEIAKKINDIKPDGVLAANKGILGFIKGMDIHLDYSFNCFNDIDMYCFSSSNYIPMISPELNLKELSGLHNKNFIALCHGNIVLMTTKQRIAAPEIIDEDGRHFNVRQSHHVYEILNNKQLGLFNKVKDYLKQGIRYFYLDLSADAGKFIRIYRRILNNEPFDDARIMKGYTTAHFSRGVG